MWDKSTPKPAGGVLNDYKLPKADGGGAIVSAHIRHDGKQYQPNDFGIWRDEDLTSYHKVHLRSHTRWRVAFIAPVASDVSGDHRWPKPSLTIFKQRTAWVDEKFHLQPGILMLKYRRTLTKQNHYLGWFHWVLKQIQRNYTCFQLLLRKCSTEWNQQHTTLPLWTWKSVI